MTSVSSATSAPTSSMSLAGLDASAQREEAIIHGIIQARVELLQNEYRKVVALRNELFNPDTRVDDIKENRGILDFKYLEYTNGELYVLERTCAIAEAALKKLKNQAETSNWINLWMRDECYKASSYGKSTPGKRNDVADIKKAVEDLEELIAVRNICDLAQSRFKEALAKYRSLRDRVQDLRDELGGQDPLYHPDTSRVEKEVLQMQNTLGLGNPQKMAAARAAIASLGKLIDSARENARNMVETEQELDLALRKATIAQKILLRRLPTAQHIRDLLLKDGTLSYTGSHKKEFDHYLNLSKRVIELHETLKQKAIGRTVTLVKLQSGMKKIGIDCDLGRIRHIDHLTAKMDKLQSSLPPLLEWLDLAERVIQQQREQSSSQSLS